MLLLLLSFFKNDLNCEVQKFHETDVILILRQTKNYKNDHISEHILKSIVENPQLISEIINIKVLLI